MALIPSIGTAVDFAGGLATEGPGDPPPARTDPALEVVAVPPSVTAEIGFDGEAGFGRWHRKQPLRHLRAIMACPAGQSAFWAMKSTVLAGGFQLTPAVRPSDDDTEDPDAALSLRILEECKRSADRMETPLEGWAWEMLDAVGERVKLSETVLEVAAGGPDAGRYVLKALKVKPRWSWRFRVDAALNVAGLDCWTVGGEWATLDPSKFAWFAFDPRDGDPRGSSALDAAWHAYQMLMQLWPEAFQGWRQFAFPNLLLTTGKDDRRDVPVRDRDGNPTGKTVSAETNLARAGAAMKAGAVIAGTHGSDGKVLESTRDGAMVEGAIALLEAQIIVCVLLQTRSIREAQFGSKADAENGTGVVGTFAQVIRQALCAVARRPFVTLVEANYDADIARRLVPKVSLGRIDPRLFAAIAQAIGVLYQSGYFTEHQLLWLDEFMGMPLRRPGEARVGPQRDATPGAAPDPSTPLGRAMLDLLGDIKAHLVSQGMPE